jgi:hypothetical protein
MSGRAPGDPTPEEIEARKQEVRAENEKSYKVRKLIKDAVESKHRKPGRYGRKTNAYHERD